MNSQIVIILLNEFDKFEKDQWSQRASKSDYIDHLSLTSLMKESVSAIDLLDVIGLSFRKCKTIHLMETLSFMGGIASFGNDKQWNNDNIHNTFYK